MKKKIKLKSFFTPYASINYKNEAIKYQKKIQASVTWNGKTFLALTQIPGKGLRNLAA